MKDSLQIFVALNTETAAEADSRPDSNLQSNFTCVSASNEEGKRFQFNRQNFSYHPARRVIWLDTILTVVLLDNLDIPLHNIRSLSHN